MSLPYWNTAVPFVKACLDGERISDKEKPLDAEWWDSTKNGYKNALYFCPVLEEHLTGRHGDINVRATVLSKRHDPKTKQPLLPGHLIPKKQTAKIAIDGLEPVSFQYFVKIFSAIEAIAEHDEDPEAQSAYPHARDLIRKPCIVAAFQAVKWDAFNKILERAGLGESALDEVSKKIFGHESRFKGVDPSSVLPLIKNGKDGNGKSPYNVTDFLAKSATDGINKLLDEKKAEKVKMSDIFEFSTETSSRALPVKQGNLVILR